MPCRATQDGQVMVESSEKMWSSGEGNGKPFHYSCLENPMNSMKRHPITSQQIDGETVETVTDFIFWGSKITGDGDCSHEIKRRLLLERKVMTKLDSILKSRDVTLPTKVCLVKAMVFPVVMYGYESWTVKKAEHRKLMLLNCGVGEDS